MCLLTWVPKGVSFFRERLLGLAFKENQKEPHHFGGSSKDKNNPNSLCMYISPFLDLMCRSAGHRKGRWMFLAVRNPELIRTCLLIEGFSNAVLFLNWRIIMALFRAGAPVHFRPVGWMAVNSLCCTAHRQEGMTQRRTLVPKA